AKAGSGRWLVTFRRQPNAPPAREVVLKRFDPKTDKAFQTEVSERIVTVDGDSWRIEAKKAPPRGPGGGYGPRDVRLFELPKQAIQRSTIVLRFKMKTEKVESDTAASVVLSINGQHVEWLGRSGNPIAGTTDWKSYEFRYEAKDEQPATIGILAG